MEQGNERDLRIAQPSAAGRFGIVACCSTISRHAPNVVTHSQTPEGVMRFITKLKVLLLFKLGIYEARRIRAVRQGDIVLEDGTMYALTPCELMNYAYLFFYRNTNRIPDTAPDAAIREFEEAATSSCRNLRFERFNLYLLFKNGKRTGYLLAEYLHSTPFLCRTTFNGYHVWQEIISYPFFGFYDQRCINSVSDAAAHMLASAESMMGEQINIELFGDDEKLMEDCKQFAKIMRSKMIDLMQECRSSKDGFIYQASSEGTWKGSRNPTIAQNIEKYIKEYHPNAWLELADPEGNEEALNQLATQYYSGDGVPKDLPRAIRLWKKAADNQHADAQYNLWQAYSNGNAESMNSGDALILLASAAHQGHPDAQFSLGMLYNTGVGVRYNSITASKHITEAAKNGSLRAQQFLANKKNTGPG
jgi:hypothetical protein